MASYKRSQWYTCNAKRMRKQGIPSSWLIKCVKTPRNRVKWLLIFQAGGRRWWGGGSPGNEDTPPTRWNRTCNFFPKMARGLSQGPHFRRTTTSWTTTSPWRLASLGQFSMFVLKKAYMRQTFPTSNYTRQSCRTIISVCQSSGCYVIPVGWTFREGPR